MSDEQRKESNKDYAHATMFRIDPQRLAAFRRTWSGITRCPQCDEKNDASRRFCSKCGAKLYPVEEHDEEPLRRRDRKEK